MFLTMEEMMAASASRIKQVVDFYQSHGREDTMSKFRIKGNTLRRYLRYSRHADGESGSRELPKILILDIETSPCKGVFWRPGKQIISVDNITKDWNVICWAAKWMFSDVIMSDVLTPDEAVKGDDSRIMHSIWELINDADIIIAHNGNRFDLRKLNWRFKINGLVPPMPYQSIDTLRVAQREFGSSSHKMQFLSQMILHKEKIRTDFDLWKRCLTGDPKALKDMEEYCRYDTHLLEEIYLELRPWIKSHPNLGLYSETGSSVCAACASPDLQWGKFYYTPAGKYKAYRCKCGAIGRSRFSDLTTRQRRELVRSVAR